MLFFYPCEQRIPLIYSMLTFSVTALSKSLEVEKEDGNYHQPVCGSYGEIEFLREFYIRNYDF